MPKILRALLLTVIPGILSLTAGQSPSSTTQWVRVEHTDQSSGVHSAAYALPGQTADSERKPSIVLTCDGEHDPAVIYRTGVKLSAQAHNVYDRYADSIWVVVKVDEGKPYRALWEIVPGENNTFDRAAIDKKTLRYLFAGQKMKVRFRDSQDEEHLDRFDLPGLKVSDLQPFCAAKWIAKNDLSDAERSSHLSRQH